MAEDRLDVQTEQVLVVLPRARLELPMGDPLLAVPGETHLAGFRGVPLAPDDLRLDQGQPLGRQLLGVEGVFGVAGDPVRAEIARLEAARRQLADVAETAMTLLVGHQCAPLT
nr:hypothetical protein Ade03nite_62170 [Actinoplanes derwentensis]